MVLHPPNFALSPSIWSFSAACLAPAVPFFAPATYKFRSSTPRPSESGAGRKLAAA